MITPETHLQYAQRIGEPRVVVCEIDLGSGSGGVWICLSHDYEYNDRPKMLDWRSSDRCPMSRLEEWRARRFDLAKDDQAA